MAMKKQSRKDRRDESRGMRRYERSGSEYGRISGASEMGMISEDRSAPYNLPQECVRRAYPSWKDLNGQYYDDDRQGIDRMNNENVGKVRGSMYRRGR